MFMPNEIKEESSSESSCSSELSKNTSPMLIKPKLKYIKDEVCENLLLVTACTNESSPNEYQGF